MEGNIFEERGELIRGKQEEKILTDVDIDQRSIYPISCLNNDHKQMVGDE